MDCGKTRLCVEKNNRYFEIIREFKTCAWSRSGKRKINISGMNIPILILRLEKPKKNVPGILWLHGGGYFLGMKEVD